MDGTLTNGSNTFSVTLKTASSATTVTATDTTTSTINGTTGPISVSPGATAKFVVSGSPTSIAAGGSVNFSVTAEDSLGNVTPAYSGTVVFTTTVTTFITPPADTTLTAGQGEFSVTLKHAGSQTLTATDSVTSTIKGVSNAISVGPLAT